MIAGLDEVGRGALAGPMVVVVAAYSEKVPPVDGITDSKKLTATRRERLAPMLTTAAAFIGFGWVEPWEIDELGMTIAWQRCCTRALQGAPSFDMLYVDGTEYVESYMDMQKSVTGADSSIWQVGAASIVAKVLRDAEMVHLAEFYTGYEWEYNSGYGTKQHYEGLDMYGCVREHRRLFLRKWAKKRCLEL